MLKKDTLNFIAALKENNNREWFAENKAWYERARADFEILVAQVLAEIVSFDKEIGNVNPKQCIFRIYRDTRFSQDKTPYKTHFGAVFRARGLDKSSGYYLHISPEESFLTCGHYMLMPDQLKKVRRGIYEDYETFRAILDEKNFKKEIGDLYRDEDALKRVPNGFDKEHPAAEYLKLKHFYVLKNVDEEQILSKDFVEYAGKIYKQMQPMSEFLNDLILD
ncbi:DUF2461 domain-containing protein [Dysgonomonas sp. 520]|uniref:DUF2461 domain-containing protein n=1 Tax=Dysgonomonas sp. 520 TaxID=2302931 RepID=UPI0013D8755B|nr:DUF2461 domain-containing protein [Dysgonomonas sp. 520]NDW10546.1 DUF2461 domain-containing protein [Dysgonomonas sp. 520]